jgi:hypothetical protein
MGSSGQEPACGLLTIPSLAGRFALLIDRLFKPPESRTFTPCRHGTDWTGQPSISDGFSISNAKYLSLLQWYLIAKPASSTMENFI